MRVLLVSVNRETAPYPVAPLGISYVAAAARDQGHEVRVLDLCFSENVREDVARAVSGFSPRLVGISIRNVDNLVWPASVSYVGEIEAAVAAIRSASRAPVVAGGPGFSLYPEVLLARLSLEYGVVGEGEGPFCALARCLEDGKHPAAVPNLVRRGEAARFAAAKEVGPLPGTAPARDLLDNSRYLDLGGMANLQTKRGCPFRCVYCTYPAINGSAVRLRAPADVADELSELVVHGAGHVFFVDDIFNWPHDHALGICDEIAARGIDPAWTCFATPAGMTPRLARAMKRAGCRGVEFGTDSGSSAMLRALGKPFGRDDIRAASLACREAGLPDAHYLIFGGPGETPETMGETFSFFDDLKPRAMLALLGVRIYPGTPLRAMALSEGSIREGDDLLDPRFYVSPAIGPERLQSAVAAHAKARAGWVVPGLGIRCDPLLLSALRRMGHRGPLWNIL